MAVATVLTVYGIETKHMYTALDDTYAVATVLTVYGIETEPKLFLRERKSSLALQQCLPFTVLKRLYPPRDNIININSCNSAYRLRY